MGKSEIRTVGKVDLRKPASEQAILHNRWHPDIPFAGTIEDGETVKIECVDWTGGQIGNNDSADDIRNIDLTRIHYLTGPFEIKNAEPGDVLLVEIMDVQVECSFIFASSPQPRHYYSPCVEEMISNNPFQDQPWGFTGVFDKSNGGGFLDEIYPSAAKAIWDFEGIFCTSRHIPHVKFAGLIHPGILGCAPSAEVLGTWNMREAELIAANKLDRQVALPPEPANAHAGVADAVLKEKIAKEGARTVPGRPEHGGNCDIKNLSRGSRVYLPVHVPGAKFSVGDLHFSQGDGEISFCGAIEMAGIITINFKVVKNGMADLGLKSPIYIPGPVEPQFGAGRHIYFEGFSVDEHGKQHYNNPFEDNTGKDNYSDSNDQPDYSTSHNRRSFSAHLHPGPLSNPSDPGHDPRQVICAVDFVALCPVDTILDPKPATSNENLCGIRLYTSILG
ncbi:hypothetical protein NUW58_g9198 [Xylaria curta]|uniref:Uncharacterized protein n=1 Tax=Xylaria curta TaxID=42375 RepID=A0ACC1N0K7_9PEZI|nr:hypothetical protein NUW58_g9198 [Xylaria curta]